MTLDGSEDKKIYITGLEDYSVEITMKTHFQMKRGKKMEKERRENMKKERRRMKRREMKIPVAHNRTS